MKILKTTAIAALLSCSMMTPANAAVTPTTLPSTAPTSEMTAQCAAYLASLNTTYAPREFTSVAVENVTYTIAWNADPSSSTEIPGTRASAPGATIISFADVDASGASGIGRKGGSPNLFANGIAHTVTASNSTYQQTDTYGGTVNYGYFCTPTETVAPSPALGFHHWTGPATAGEMAKSNCEGLNSGPHATSDRGENCTWEETVAAVPGGPVVRYNLSYGYPFGGVGAVTAPITGTDISTNLNGGPFTFHNASLVVNALVCNSPGSKGGTWTAKNGYAGGAMGSASTTAAPHEGCNTPFFLVAPQISGNDFGTVIPSNSLPMQ